MAGNTRPSEGLDWRILMQKAKLESTNADGYIDITNILHSMMREKYQKVSDEETFNHEELMFQMIRPEMPYGHWIPDILLHKKKKAKDVVCSEESRKPTVLDECLQKMAFTKANFPTTDNGLDIQSKLENVMEDVLGYLKENHAIFKDSSLFCTGSMYEGLKIKKIDEFDFMIEIPEMENVLKIDIKSNKEMLCVTLLDLQPFKDLPIHKVSFDASAIQDFFNKKDSRNNEVTETTSSVNNKVKTIVEAEFAEDTSNWFNIAIILRTLAILIEEKMQHFLVDDGNCRLLPRESKRHLITMENNLAHSSAFTYDLIFGDRLVNVDVALAVPVKNLPLLFNKSEKLKHLPEDYAERFLEKPVTHHAIFRNSSTLRISLSCKEKELLGQYSQDDPRKVCIRLVKFLRKKFITHLKWREEEPSCLLNSYHIKTVFFFLFEKYKENDEWSIDRLSSRIIEALTILKKCFEERQLESFFIPHYNILRKYFFVKDGDLNDADTVTSDIEHLLNLFSDMDKLNFDAALELFLDTMKKYETSIVKVITDKEKLKRHTTAVTSYLF